MSIRRSRQVKLTFCLLTNAESKPFYCWPFNSLKHCKTRILNSVVTCNQIRSKLWNSAVVNICQILLVFINYAINCCFEITNVPRAKVAMSKSIFAIIPAKCFVKMQQSMHIWWDHPAHIRHSSVTYMAIKMIFQLQNGIDPYQLLSCLEQNVQATVLRFTIGCGGVV